MLHFASLLLAVAFCQEPKKSAPPPPTEDDAIPGLPDGEPAPLPERVRWDLKKAVIAETSVRERINLEGLWRFAAVPEAESPVVRAEMGWMEMPGHWKDGRTRVYDAKFRVADGLWRGKPLEEFPWAWVERDISITNADALKWLSHRVFLVIRGPWAQSEVIASQRVVDPKAKDAERKDGVNVPEVCVHAEPVEGTDRGGERWFELSEALIYPGTTQLSMRLKADATPEANKNRDDAAEPRVSLELLPIGPRVEAIRLRRDSAHGEIEASFDLMRPPLWPLRPGPPIKTVKMALRLRLEDAETGRVLQKLDEDIGTMPDLTRTASLRLRWSAEKDQPPPQRARLLVRFGTAAGGLYDEPFPIEFRPAELDPVVD